MAKKEQRQGRTEAQPQDASPRLGLQLAGGSADTMQAQAQPADFDPLGDWLAPTAGDLAAPQQGTLKRLRDTHHRIARLLAAGYKQVQVSEMTGFSQSRISILMADPTFQSLLDSYRREEQELFYDVQQRMETLGLAASSELLERIAENPDGISNSELREIAKMALDRAGYAPLQRSENKNVNLSLTPEQALEMKRAARAAESGRIIPKGQGEAEADPEAKRSSAGPDEGTD